MADYLMTTMRKARLTLDYLQSNGGALPEEVEDRFWVLAIKNSDFLMSSKSTTMGSTTYRIPTWEVGSRALHKRTRGQALVDAQRTRPDTTGPVITAYDYAAEVVLERENLESGVEGPGMLNLVMRTLQERTSSDSAEIAMLSDTTSADVDLENFDGFIAGLTTNTASAGTTRLSPVNCTTLFKTLPSQFQKPGMTIRTGTNAQIDYGNAVEDRPTTLGDSALEAKWRPHWKGHEIKGDQHYPQNLGGGTNETVATIANEKNWWNGFHRRLENDSDKDIRAGTIFVVFTIRMGGNWAADKTAAKLTGVLAS